MKKEEILLVIVQFTGSYRLTMPLSNVEKIEGNKIYYKDIKEITVLVTETNVPLGNVPLKDGSFPFTTITFSKLKKSP